MAALDEPDRADGPSVSAAPYAEKPVPPAGHSRSSPVPPFGSATSRSWLAWLAGRLPDVLRGAAVDPGRAGIRALAVVGVFAAVVAATFLWRARPAAVPAPPVASHAAQVSPAPSSTPSAPAVVVHVAGKVREPGVFTLPAGSRVVDAVRAAGGVRDGADTGRLNLARLLVDGEQILVGVTAPPAPPAPPGAPGPASGDPTQAINLNTATAEDLEELPGVGPVLAGRIVDYRTQHGGFRSVEQLRDVSGIGPKRFADLKDRVRV